MDDHYPPLQKWRTIQEEIVFENPWWIYKRNRFALPTGKTGAYHFVHTPGSAMIIPVTVEGSFVMVEQYRYLNDRPSLEFPCGGVKVGHTYEGTARRELQEEANLSAVRLLCIGKFNPMNGVTDEICAVFVATGLAEMPGHLDETEEINIRLLGSEQIVSMIREERIWDGMTLAAWMLYRTKCGDA
jgi:8-oxo-dGTP pyrophosphatase MutT (NUDIX family)